MTAVSRTVSLDEAIIIGLDFGTTGVKLAAVTPDGTTLFSASASYPTDTGVASADGTVIVGSSEQNPDEWWRAARVVCGALATAGLSDRAIALGVTGQMQNLVPVKATPSRGEYFGFAVRPAMLYSDTRASLEHETLRARVPRWEERTGNHQDVTNVAAKILWLAHHEPDSLHDATHLLLGAHSYIVWRAAGATPEAALCDVVTASTTGLLDVTTGRFDAATLSLAGSHIEQLPRLIGSRDATGATIGAVAGLLDPVAGAELRLPAGIPVVHATGDAGATTDGLAGSAPGDAYLYLGSSGWLAGITPAAANGTPDSAPSPIHALVMPGWHTRLRIGAVQSAGSAAAWALATFLPGCDFDEAQRRITDRVSQPAAIAARPLVLPGLRGERTPVRDGAMRGAFVGVTDASQSEDLYLGVLTGVAMGLKHAADAMGIAQDRLPLVGGGSTSPAWRQICADVFGATIVTGDTAGEADEDPGSRSAARAAADAIGVSHRIEPLLSGKSNNGRSLHETHPGPAHEFLTAQLPTHRALYTALTPTFHRLA